MKTTKIYDGNNLIAYIINTQTLPDKTTFVTTPDCQQQVGYIVYPENSEIPAHIHQPQHRELSKTTEVLVVISGRCLVDFYRENKTKLVTHLLEKDDVVIILDGGHGFRMLEDTTFLEVKQGPYHGTSEKINL